MKNLLRALVLLILATASVQSGVMAQAQTTAQKRVVTIDDSTGELVDITQAQPAGTSAPGIVILNNQKSDQGSSQVAAQKATNTAIQDQPTNVIEDSPLSTSAAERRRRERQGLEMQTEQKIVEKLEDARIEDEKARSERLFNKGFGSGDKRDDKRDQDETPRATPAPHQVQIIQAPPVVVEKKEEPKVNVREEVRAALSEMKPKEESPENKFYVQGLVGLGEYPDASNMKGKMAMGFAVGVVTDERIVAEGAFQYSQYDIDRATNNQYTNGPFKKMSQYNFQAAVKYQFLSGKVRPVVGAVASYTYRSYEFQQQPGYMTSYNSNSNTASTNAFDVGALVGLDIQMTNSFSIGADVRYMKNVGSRENSEYSNSYTAYGITGKRVEEFNYYIASLVGRFTF